MATDEQTSAARDVINAVHNLNEALWPNDRIPFFGLSATWLS